MTLRLQLLLLVAVVLLLFWIIRQVKSRKLELRYTLSWLLLIVALILLVIFPGILNWIAEALGIQSPMNALTLSGFIFSLAIIYTLTVAVSKQSEEIKKLTQQLALYDKKLRSLASEENKENDEK